MLLRNPRILLLDEVNRRREDERESRPPHRIEKSTPLPLSLQATAALDAASEAVVQRALDSAAVGRTTLVVAHRLATVARAHTVAVIGGGVVVEQGPPADLAARGGAYAALLAASAGKKK